MPTRELDRVYEQGVLSLLDNEKDFLNFIIGSVLAQHAEERTLVTKMADHYGLDEVMDNYDKATESDIRGFTTLILIVAEIYRVLLKEGKITQIDAINLANTIGMKPGVAQSIAKASKDKLGEIGLDGIINDPILHSIERMNEFEITDEEAKCVTTADALVEEAIKTAKKRLRRHGYDK